MAVDRLSKQFQVALVGGGPAGLMAAERLAEAGHAVTLFERMPSLGRKLLMAGRGGLNLTHSEPAEPFLARYGTAAPWMAPHLAEFGPEALRAWSDGLGQETFVGTSGRVFPKALKASPLLRAWLGRLDRLGVRFALRHRWIGWDESGALAFETPDGTKAVPADAVLLALGGGSWPRLGSDGSWTALLEKRGVAVASLLPANGGFQVPWSSHFRGRFEGMPLKPLAMSFGGTRVRGEAMITASGIEGGAVYALSAALRGAILKKGEAILRLDLVPDLTPEILLRRVSEPRRGQSLSTFLRKNVRLSPLAVALVQESCEGRPPAEAAALATLIKAAPLRLTGLAPIERAISTAGGVTLDAIDERSMLRALPGTFVAGEMLDWEAPTGGYLLQGCLASGVAAAGGMDDWLRQQR